MICRMQNQLVYCQLSIHSWIARFLTTSSTPLLLLKLDAYGYNMILHQLNLEDHYLSCKKQIVHKYVSYVAIYVKSSWPMKKDVTFACDIFTNIVLKCRNEGVFKINLHGFMRNFTLSDSRCKFAYTLHEQPRTIIS